jgi:hypothetical protein
VAAECLERLETRFEIESLVLTYEPRKRESCEIEMARKRYPANPTVNETKPYSYGREKRRGQGLRAAASLAIVKLRLERPIRRTRRDIGWALGIVGIGEGPADLSQRARDYRYGNK